MSTGHVIDKEKGTKWFTFYTKIRPWILVLYFLAVVLPNFIFICTQIEHPMLLVFQHPMLLISFGLSVAQTVVCAKTFDKSSGDYLEFVDFVRGVLVFEAWVGTFQGFYTQYYLKGFLPALIVAAIIGVLAYFIWYKMMSAYFHERVTEATIN